MIGGFAEVGDSDVEVGGAVVFSGASVVVAGGFGVVGTIVVGTMVVEVPTSSAEATWTKENDDTTSARTATIIPKAAHRDTTPSPGTAWEDTVTHDEHLSFRTHDLGPVSGAVE